VRDALALAVEVILLDPAQLVANRLLHMRAGCANADIWPDRQGLNCKVSLYSRQPLAREPSCPRSSAATVWLSIASQGVMALADFSFFSACFVAAAFS
jgi:hypothetical protein